MRLISLKHLILTLIIFGLFSMENIDIRYLQHACYPTHQTKWNQWLKNFQSRWKDSHYWSMRLFCKVDQAHSISTYAVNQ